MGVPYKLDVLKHEMRSGVKVRLTDKLNQFFYGTINEIKPAGLPNEAVILLQDPEFGVRRVVVCVG